MPLADPYDPAKLGSKLDAGADFVITQIVYDVPALAAWADRMRGWGLFERAKVVIGVTRCGARSRPGSWTRSFPGSRFRRT